jgi:MraZ protein, putative antitoxin-like
VPKRGVKVASALAEIDPPGRRAIPNALRISVERTANVVLVGMDACIEVWSPGCWSARVSGLEAWHDMGFGKVLDVWSYQIEAHDHGAIWHAGRDGPSPRQESLREQVSGGLIDNVLRHTWLREEDRKV